MSSCSFFGCIFAIIWLFCVCSGAEVEKEHVLTLDHSNFSETVNKHDFIVVEFYAPWCGHCQKLAPEYEKAALVLSSHDPPIVLAKVDLNEEPNKELAIIFQIKGFPTLKVVRNGGKIVQDYKGPREADGIVSSLKKLLGPASAEIKSAGDVASQFDEKKIYIVGIFPEFSGEDFEKFSIVAETLRSEYDFGHTQDAKHLPRGEEVSKPTLRLFKPFDELSVDFQDFDVDAIKKFIEESSLPLVTIFDENPENEPYMNKFFASPEDKAMLFLNFSTDRNCFESKYQDAATFYKGKGIRFLMGDAQSSGKVFKFFGLSQDQTPLLFIRENNGTKYLKANIQADQIASWLNDYEKGNLKPYIKSEPIPEVNDELVKVVVADSLQDMVFNSGKNVLLEFFAPWCGYCKRLDPFLEEAAGLYENNTDFMIAKMDATANDVPGDIFEVKRYPTLYFVSANGKVTEYKWDLLKQDIMYFIEKNYGKPIQQESTEKDTIKKQESIAKDTIKSGIVGEVSAKDEL